MNNQWAKVCFIGFVAASVAFANHEGKAPALSGSFEGGIGYSVTPSAASGVQWFVDSVHLNHHFDVSDKTKVIVHNAFAVNGFNAGPGGTQNGSAYFSGATIAAGQLTFSNLAAYIQHECSKGVHMSFGNEKTVFGMESLWDRYEMHSYYYSPLYTATQVRGWNYDLSWTSHLTDIVPGSLEIQLSDGRNGRGAGGAAFGAALRWMYEYKSNDWSLTPVVSTLLQNWSGSPQDLGIQAGFMYKMGTLWANLDFEYTKMAAAKAWQINVEPGIDFGAAELSLKYDFVNSTTTSTTDHWIGAAISKTYDDKYRVKATYQHQNLSGKLGAHVNDFRLLFATKF
jgi:hypothetical protein